MAPDQRAGRGVDASRVGPTGKKLRHLKANAEISTVVSVPGEPAQVYERVARIARSIIAFDRWSVAAYNEAGGSFTEVYVLDTRMPGWRRCETYRLRGPLAAEVIEDGRVDLLLANLKGKTAPPTDGTFPARFPSMIRVPIEFRSQLVGSLTLRSERPRAYNNRHLALARDIAARLAPTVEYFRLLSNSQIDDERRADERRSRSVMLATLSEKLRNPISAARTATSVISNAVEAGRVGAVDQRTVELLTRSIERLNSMVERAFDYAVVEQYSSPIAFRIVNLADLIVQEFAVFEQARRERSIQLDLPQVSLPVDAYVEPVLLKKCLHELIDNAHRYTPDGGSISLSVIPEDLWISVQITNTGTAIPAEEQRLMFAPFFRGRNASGGPGDGMGLGLGIARAAARLHGGTVTLESGPDYVRACLKVPSAIARRSPTPATNGSRAPSRASAGSSSLSSH